MLEWVLKCQQIGRATTTLIFFNMATFLLGNEEGVGKKTSNALETISKIEALGEEILTDKYQVSPYKNKILLDFTAC